MKKTFIAAAVMAAGLMLPAGSDAVTTKQWKTMTAGSTKTKKPPKRAKNKRKPKKAKPKLEKTDAQWARNRNREHDVAKQKVGI